MFVWTKRLVRRGLPAQLINRFPPATWFVTTYWEFSSAGRFVTVAHGFVVVRSPVVSRRALAAKDGHDRTTLVPDRRISSGRVFGCMARVGAKLPTLARLDGHDATKIWGHD